MAKIRKTNVLRTGGKASKEAVTGLKELEAKLKALAPEHPEMARWLQNVVGKASIEMRNEMAAQARAAGWGTQRITNYLSEKKGTGKRRLTGKTTTVEGQAAIDSIFAFTRGRPSKSGKAKVSALAGVTKPKTMIEWRAGLYPRSPRAKRSYPTVIAEAFATMLEFGTSRMAARPAIRTAVKTARPRVIQAVSDGFNAVLEKFSA